LLHRNGGHKNYIPGDDYNDRGNCRRPQLGLVIGRLYVYRGTYGGVGEYLFSFGLMVQKGKFSAGAALWVRTLKKVDLPTLGTPTIPILRFVPILPISGLRSGSSCFFGGILVGIYLRGMERYGYISDIGGFIFGTPEGAEHNLTLPAAGSPFTFSRGRYPLSAELRLQLSV